ncbi:AAA family ATPase [Rhizobium leguminosarum bv. trifolii]|uniref:AAA family ATPase n=1 Tax=Rhizobium ruizarguesonis TaxID=2081791 RepID=UPI0013EE46ED|nr:AAA family ATPase [Rhizobium ruizarguesonis]QIO45137.1 AAA family ATPase [Rhizobium leguminosarum bv. trifolii]
MFRFGLKNMRRLRNIEPIEIRPITILVGRNSSGKSTFLRTFPLIRQSLMTRTSSPILWYGDLVDFGDYASVLSDGQENGKISFSFGLDEVKLPRTPYFRMYEISPTQEKLGAVDIELFIAPDEGKVRLESFTLNYEMGAAKSEVLLDNIGNISKILHNGVDLTKWLETVTVSLTLGSMFPDVTIRPKKKDTEIFLYDDRMWCVPIFMNLIKGHVGKRISDQSFVKFATSFLALQDLSEASLLEFERNASNRSFRSFLSSIHGGNKNNLKEQIQSLFYVARVIRYMPAIFSTLRNIMGSTLYIGPMRARSERYYRYQDLAVSEIDPDGKNFPMFLNALTNTQREDFSQWVYDRFGYGVEVKELSGHISINLKVGNYTTNIVDNGYGISQVLPVLGQIWWASRGSSRRSLPPIRRADSAILVIEQPELHLHPAHQALIADAIVSERSDAASGTPLQFIVETHSEALINSSWSIDRTREGGRRRRPGSNF